MGKIGVITHIYKSYIYLYKTYNYMTLNLIEIEIELNQHSQNWINVISINSWHLFHIEWNYIKKIEYLQILGINII